MGDLFGLRQAFTASAVITLLGLPLIICATEKVTIHPLPLPGGGLGWG